MRTMIAALVACLALPALARPLTDDPRLTAELEQVRGSIAARELDQALNLSRDQARKLLPEVQALARKRAELERKREVAARGVLAALQRVDDELARTGKVSDDTLAKLQAARQGARPAAEEKQALKELHAKIRALLTPEQQQALRHQRSVVFAGKGGDARGKHGRIGGNDQLPPPPGAGPAMKGEGHGQGRQGDGPGVGDGGNRGGKKGKGRALRLLGSPQFEKLLQQRAK